MNNSLLTVVTLLTLGIYSNTPNSACRNLRPNNASEVHGSFSFLNLLKPLKKINKIKKKFFFGRHSFHVEMTTGFQTYPTVEKR